MVREIFSKFHDKVVFKSLMIHEKRKFENYNGFLIINNNLFVASQRDISRIINE